MTTITIERELLEQAIGERNLPMRQIQHAILALRAALAAPEQCWCDEQGIGEPAMRCVDCPTRDYKGAATAPTTTSIEDHTLERLLDAWDTTVLPKHRDGAMQEWMEALRHEFMTCPDNSIKGRVTSLAAPESGAMAEIDYTDDDALRFIQRVLESNAPESDIRDARNMVVEIRTRVLKARASKPATAPDRHAQELLAQDITIANMRERHAQELCAYQITVDKLKAERKPMTDEEIVDAIPDSDVEKTIYEWVVFIVRAVEAHHGIGDKT